MLLPSFKEIGQLVSEIKLLTDGQTHSDGNRSFRPMDLKKEACGLRAPYICKTTYKVIWYHNEVLVTFKLGGGHNGL